MFPCLADTTRDRELRFLIYLFENVSCKIRWLPGFAREQSFNMALLLALVLGLAAAEELNPITRVAQLLEGLAKKVEPFIILSEVELHNF